MQFGMNSALKGLLAQRPSAPCRLRAVQAQAKAAGAKSDKVNVSPGDGRPVWFPGNAPPPHLDGSLPGDFGFDPLSLGSDEKTLKWFQQAELVHSRVAMTAVAGILFPSFLTKIGVLNVPDWWVGGQVWITEHPSFPFASLLFVQLALCGFVEVKRWQDFINPGSQGDGSFLGLTTDLKGQSNGYPGGKLFDPFGFSRDSEAALEKYKWNEIRNGRLAMVAFVGFVFQHLATGKDPLDNLVDHIRAPNKVTFATNGVSLPFLRY